MPTDISLSSIELFFVSVSLSFLLLFSFSLSPFFLSSSRGTAPPHCQKCDMYSEVLSDYTAAVPSLNTIQSIERREYGGGGKNFAIYFFASPRIT